MLGPDGGARVTAVTRARASDRDRWDALVVGRAGTITHSWGHAEFVRRGGWPIDRFIATGSHGETVGALLGCVPAGRRSHRRIRTAGTDAHLP